jgi:mRNA interferase MazF
MIRASRGDVWIADFTPVVGHEQSGKRPALVISSDDLNHTRAALSVVVPFTTTDRGVRLHVRVDPPEGGLRKRSFALTEQIRCLSTRRFLAHLGRISDAKLREVEAAVQALLELHD